MLVFVSLSVQMEHHPIIGWASVCSNILNDCLNEFHLYYSWVRYERKNMFNEKIFFCRDLNFVRDHRLEKLLWVISSRYPQQLRTLLIRDVVFCFTWLHLFRSGLRKFVFVYNLIYLSYSMRRTSLLKFYFIWLFYFVT